MGEIADAILDGELCQVRGVYMDDKLRGFPRTCKGCEEEEAKEAKEAKE